MPTVPQQTPCPAREAVMPLKTRSGQKVPLQPMPQPMLNSHLFPPFRKCSRSAFVFPLALLLAACGGSSGGGGDSSNGDGGRGSSTQTPCLQADGGDCLTNEELAARRSQIADAIQRATRSVARGSENWARDAVNAYEAYANLRIVKGATASALPGSGVTIGFVDSGIQKEHPDFAGGRVVEYFDKRSADEPLFSQSHGTQVASAAVGLSSGIAWGANATMYSSRNTQTVSGILNLPASEYQSILNSVDILNLSFGRPGTIEESWTETQVRDFYNDNFPGIVNAWAQQGVSEKTIMVWAAGNENSKVNAHSPSLDSGAVRFIPELRGHWVTVVATDRSGTIADFSNRCGIAAEWCIAAPGERVLVGSYDPSGAGTSFYKEVNGTSFAAPMVSGGLAVMKQLFRGQLSNTALVSRLFQTARKSGIHANQAVYGQGLMDLGAATNPWGTPAFMGTRSSVAEATGASVQGSHVAMGTALGDSLPQSLDQAEIAAFDDLGAPFWYEADQFTVPSEGASVATRLNRFLTPPSRPAIPPTWQFKLQEDAPATEIGHLALTHGASRLTMAGPQGFSATAFQRAQDDQSPLAALTLAYTPSLLPSLTFAAGYLDEQQSLLGSQGSGAFGELSGETLFLSAGLNTALGDWQLAATGEIGQVSPGVSGSQLIDSISSLSTSAFRLAASRPFANGSTLRFSLAQPLRVNSGVASLSLPTGRTQAGTVVGRTLSAPLVPTGQQLDLSAQLDLPWLDGDLSLGATRSTQPRHQRTAAPEWTFFTGYRTSW